MLIYDVNKLPSKSVCFKCTFPRVCWHMISTKFTLKKCMFSSVTSLWYVDIWYQQVTLKKCMFSSVTSLWYVDIWYQQVTLKKCNISSVTSLWYVGATQKVKNPICWKGLRPFQHIGLNKKTYWTIMYTA